MTTLPPNADWDADSRTGGPQGSADGGSTIPDRWFGALVTGTAFLCLAWAVEHPLVLPVLGAPGDLAGVVRSALAGLAGALGIWSLIVLLGAGLVRREDLVAAAGAGLAWIIGGGTVLLLLGRLRALDAAILLAPLFRVPWRSLPAGFPLPGDRRLAALVLAMGFLLAPLALAPDTTFDDHVYHLGLVRGFTETGSCWFDSLQPNTFRPFAYAVLPAWIACLFGPLVAQLTGTALILGGGILLASRGGAFGLVGCLAWFAHPEWVRLAEGFFAEPVLCLVVLLLALEGGQSRGFFRQGWLLGMLPGIKYSGLYLWLFLLPLLLPEGPGMGGRRWWASLLAGILLAGALVAGPALARNLHFTGYPLYPHSLGKVVDQPRHPFHRFMADVPGTGEFFGAENAILTERFGMGREPLDLLLAPWNVVVHGHFHDQKYPLRFFDGFLGPLALVPWLLIPFWLKQDRFRAVAVLAFATFAWISWLAGSHQIRHLLPLVVVGAATAGQLAHVLGYRVRVLLLVVGLFSLPWVAESAGHRLVRAAPALSGRWSEERYLTERLPPFAAILWANRNLTASGTRLLVLLEERTFHLRVPYLWTGLLPHWFLDVVYRCGDLATLDALLDRQGITHVLIPRFGVDLFPQTVNDPRYQTMLRDFFNSPSCLEPIYREDWAVIFARRRPQP